VDAYQQVHYHMTHWMPSLKAEEKLTYSKGNNAIAASEYVNSSAVDIENVRLEHIVETSTHWICITTFACCVVTCWSNYYTSR
jgi:hypothetical protein